MFLKSCLKRRNLAFDFFCSKEFHFLEAIFQHNGCFSFIKTLMFSKAWQWVITRCCLFSNLPTKIAAETYLFPAYLFLHLIINLPESLLILTFRYTLILFFLLDL